MSEDLKARREAAEAAIAKLEEEAANEREARAVAILEARVKYAAELGREGIDFVVFDAGAEGPIVLKLAPLVVYQEFHSKLQEDGKLSLATLERFILPSVAFPDKKAVTGILDRRGTLYVELTNVLKTLHGVNEAAQKGK